MSRERIKKKLKVHPEEAEVIRLIYGLYLEDLGAKAIAERLNGEGYSYRGSHGQRDASLTSLEMKHTSGVTITTRRTGGLTVLSLPRNGSKYRLIPLSMRRHGKGLKPSRKPGTQVDLKLIPLLLEQRHY